MVIFKFYYVSLYLAYYLEVALYFLEQHKDATETTVYQRRKVL